MSIKIKPLGDRVLLRKVVTKTQEEVVNGLVIPIYSHRDDRHTVVALGPDCVEELYEGDEVLVLPNAHKEIVDTDWGQVCFVREKDISAVNG